MPRKFEFLETSFRTSSISSGIGCSASAAQLHERQVVIPSHQHMMNIPEADDQDLLSCSGWESDLSTLLSLNDGSRDVAEDNSEADYYVTAAVAAEVAELRSQVRALKKTVEAQQYEQESLKKKIYELEDSQRWDFSAWTEPLAKFVEGVQLLMLHIVLPYFLLMLPLLQSKEQAKLQRHSSDMHFVIAFFLLVRAIFLSGWKLLSGSHRSLTGSSRLLSVVLVSLLPFYWKVCAIVIGTFSMGLGMGIVAIEKIGAMESDDHRVPEHSYSLIPLIVTYTEMEDAMVKEILDNGWWWTCMIPLFFVYRICTDASQAQIASIPLLFMALFVCKITGVIRIDKLDYRWICTATWLLSILHNYIPFDVLHLLFTLSICGFMAVRYYSSHPSSTPSERSGRRPSSSPRPPSSGEASSCWARPATTTKFYNTKKDQ